jgi:hypothetical protein
MEATEEAHDKELVVEELETVIGSAWLAAGCCCPEEFEDEDEFASVAGSGDRDCCTEIFCDEA